MLRLAVLLLLLANLGYYTWSAGMLAPWGMAPAHEGEPERVARQIAPQALQVLSSTATDDASPAAPPPTSAPTSMSTPAVAVGNGDAAQCLQAGPLDAARAASLRASLAALPAGAWQMESREVAGRWMVYMGRFADEDALAKKRAELRALKIGFDRPGAALEPGLSLGRFSTEEAAQRALGELSSRGLRTARVVQERSGQASYLLRLPSATAPLRAQLNALGIHWGDTPLQPCRPSGG